MRRHTKKPSRKENNMANGTEIAKAYVQLIPTTQGMQSNITSLLSGDLQTAGEEGGILLGGSVVSKAALAIAGGAAAIGAAVGAVIKNASEVANMGDTIDKQSQKVGLSTKAYQEWSFMLQHTGADISVLNGSMRTLSNVVTDASNGSDGATKKLQALGLSVKDLNGLSQEEQLTKVVNALQGMESGAERTAIAQDLLGRGSQEMAALLNMSSSEMEDMRSSLTDLGGVMSEDSVKASADYKDSLLDMQTAMTGVKTRAMSEFLPSMSTVMKGVSQIVSGDGGGFATIISGASQFASQLFTLGGTMMNNLLTAIRDKLPTIIENGSNTIAQFAKGLGDKIPMMVGKAGELIATLVQGIVRNLPKIITGGINIITSLASGLIQAIPKLVAKVPEIIGSIKDAFLSVDWAQVGMDILRGIGNGLMNVGGAIGSAIGDAASGLLSYFKDKLGIHSPSRVFRDEVGYNIMRGLAEGITSNTDLYDNAVNDAIGTFDNEYQLGLSASTPVNSQENALGQVINLLGQLLNATNRDSYLVVNGRQFAMATASDIDYALGVMNKKGGRK